MAQALVELDILTDVHKYYAVEEWAAFINTPSVDVLKHVMVSTGISDVDFEKTVWILALNFVCICIDVANGYSGHFVQIVTKAREIWPTKTICIGNVVTGEMCEELILFSERRYRESRKWSRFHMHDSCKNRRRLSATVGGYRMH